MLIRGTKKIKGILDLYSIKQQLKPGQSLVIPENDYWQSDVQMAVRMGLLQTDTPKGKKETKKPDATKMIKFKNIHSRPIGLEGHKEEIPSGQEFFLSEEETETNVVRHAIGKGLIKVIGSNKEISEIEESTVTVLNKLKPDENVNTPPIDTNEEIPMPTVVKDKKGVVWNTSNDEIRNVEIASHVIDTETPDAVDSNRGDPRKSSIVMDPNKTRNKEDNIITFVDKEEEEKHAASHPKLKPKKTKEIEEEPVDKVEEEKRVAQHPVLSKKTKKTTEDAFIDDLDDIQARIRKHPILKKKAKEEETPEPPEEDVKEEIP